MRQNAIVRIVSNDSTLRAGFARLLATVGRAAEHRSGAEAADDRRHGCELVHLAAEDSIDPWLRALRMRRDTAAPPVILLSLPRAGIVPMAVEALKSGAWDFLEIPCNGQILLDSVQRAMSEHERAAREQDQLRALRARFESLTPREYEVLEPLARGWSNRRMAAALGVTEKTIEAYRARVMRKTGAAHLPQLMRMAIRSGLIPEPLLAPTAGTPDLTPDADRPPPAARTGTES